MSNKNFHNPLFLWIQKHSFVGPRNHPGIFQRLEKVDSKFPILLLRWIWFTELEGKVSPEGIFQAIHSIQILEISSIHKPYIHCWQGKKIYRVAKPIAFLSLRRRGGRILSKGVVE